MNHRFLAYLKIITRSGEALNHQTFLFMPIDVDPIVAAQNSDKHVMLGCLPFIEVI